MTIYFAVMWAVSAVAAYLLPETHERDFLGEEKRGEGRFVRDRGSVRDRERVGS